MSQTTVGTILPGGDPGVLVVEVACVVDVAA